MEILQLDNNTFLPKKPIAATIGFFDGVHLGHRFLINQLKEIANRQNRKSAVITFPRHPRETLRNGYLPELLTDTEEKLALLAQTGIDYCYLLDFTKEVSELTSYQFIKQILSDRLHVSNLLIGYNHRFGKNRAEGFDQYKNYGEELGIQVIQAKELPVEQQSVSSTEIRKKLKAGQLEEANRLLSYPYRLSGKVIQGNKLGRQIGFPTANLQVVHQKKLIPGNGIYAVWVYADSQKIPGMAYIGNRPTILPDGEKRFEVFLIGFSGDLYNRILNVEFIRFLREDQHFENINALQKQLEKDRENTILALR